MIKVQVRPNEPLEAALRRFKRQCNYAGIFRLAKKYNFYEKRSDKNRREERERIRNIQRMLRKQQGVQTAKRRKSKVKASVQNRDESTEAEAEESAEDVVATGASRTRPAEKVTAGEARAD